MSLLRFRPFAGGGAFRKAPCFFTACSRRLVGSLVTRRPRDRGLPERIRSNFQVIVATTRDLDDEIDEGRFLLDLRNRLIGFDISLIPLRERKEDLPVLTELCFSRHGLAVPEEKIDQIAKRCSEFYWRGNIRQLMQVLQAWNAQTEGNEQEIRAENLPVFKLMMAPGDDSLVPKSLGVQGIPADAGRFIRMKKDRV